MLLKGVPVPLFLMQQTEGTPPLFLFLQQTPQKPGVRRSIFNVTESFI